MTIMGKEEEAVEAVVAEVEEEKKASLATKAVTDAMHTGNTGYGAEMVTSYIYKDEMYSLIVQDKKSILPMLPGNHGEILAPSALISVKGRVNKFTTGSEWTGGAFYGSLNEDNAMATARLTLPIAKFSTMISISKEELQYSTDRGLFNTVQNAIVRASNETITSVILNGDTQSNTATGNVNQKDNGTGTALASQHWLAINNGLRKLAIANTITGGAVAHDTSVYKGMLSTIGDYAAEPQDCIWILSSKTALSARYVPGYRTQQDFGNGASVNTPNLPATIEGIETLQTRELARLVGNDGYVYEGTTETGATAKNLYGQLLLVYKPAIQYAFGMPMQIIVHETSGAFLLDVSFRFGFVIANATAGLDKTVALWVVL